MNKTKVINLRKDPYDIYIGRGSKWGNPFSHKDGTRAKIKVDSRKDAIKMYEIYLLENKELMAALPELKGKVLGCFCKPSSCHGDILAKYANALDSALF